MNYKTPTVTLLSHKTRFYDFAVLPTLYHNLYNHDNGIDLLKFIFIYFFLVTHMKRFLESQTIY